MQLATVRTRKILQWDNYEYEHSPHQFG